MRKRKVWVEPLFGEGKAWHGLTRFRLRTLLKVNIEALLIATGQNLKRLLSTWSWGRRPYPGGKLVWYSVVWLFPTLSAACNGSGGGAGCRRHRPLMATRGFFNT